MRKEKRIRRSGRVSASAYNHVLDQVEDRELGTRARTVRWGRRSLTPAEQHIIGEFAVINDATARPIAADTPYTVNLVDKAGTIIPGSSFKAYEVTGDRSVPDDSPIVVHAVQGDWGFLRRVGFEEWATAKENFATIKEAVPGGGGVGYKELFNPYKHTSVADERRVLIHADHTYGTGRKIQRLGLSFPNFSDSCWDVQDTAGPAPTGTLANMNVYLRAIRTDFNPATVTWTQAQAFTYGSYFSVASMELEGTGTGDQWTVDVDWVNGNIFASVIGSTWNGYASIYGVEVSLDLGNEAGLDIQWEVDLTQCDPISCYAMRE